MRRKQILHTPAVATGFLRHNDLQGWEPKLDRGEQSYRAKCQQRVAGLQRLFPVSGAMLLFLGVTSLP